MITELMWVVDAPMEDKNGTMMMYGRTAEYKDAAGVFNKGALVTCYNPELWDEFVVGLKVRL